MEDSLAACYHLLPVDSVLVPMKSAAKNDAFDELFSRLRLLRNLDRVHLLKQAVLERENCGNTGIGHGVAVAHGKCESLSDIYLCLGISYRGIDYGSYDGGRVHLLFVAANPPAMQGRYLRMLAALGGYLRDPGVREFLVGAEAHIVREILHGVLVNSVGGVAASA